MAPLNESTRVVLPLGWVASAALGVTIVVCSFFYHSIDSLQTQIKQLQIDVAIIKDHTNSNEPNRNVVSIK